MKMEHLGIQVQAPLEMAEWYCSHLGFKLMRQQTASPFTAFIADSSGSVMLEIHHHLDVALPDYAQTDPLVQHLAFDVGDEPVESAAQRLLAAGASLAKPLVVTASGDRLMMLRDPWGLAVQLVKRAERMV